MAVEFVRETVQHVETGEIFERTRLDRLTDGRIACCICFEFFPREALEEIEPGMYTDVCKPCYREDVA